MKMTHTKSGEMQCSVNSVVLFSVAYIYINCEKSTLPKTSLDYNYVHNLFYKTSLNKRAKMYNFQLYGVKKQKEAKNVHKNVPHIVRGHRTSEPRIVRVKRGNLKGWNSEKFSTFSENLRFHSVCHRLS